MRTTGSTGNRTIRIQHSINSCLIVAHCKGMAQDMRSSSVLSAMTEPSDWNRSGIGTISFYMGALSVMRSIRCSRAPARCLDNGSSCPNPLDFSIGRAYPFSPYSASRSLEWRRTKWERAQDKN